MPIRVQDVVDAGFSLSAASRPELIAVQAAALVRVVDRVQHALFAFAARVNPLFFGTVLDVASQGPSVGWPIPANAESIIGVDGLGTQTTPTLVGDIAVVPFEDRAAFAGTPSVYRLGGSLRSSGNAGDPADGLLRLTYARRPAALLALTSVLDEAFPAAYVGIFEFEVAAFNARSDGGRDGELAVMVAERDRMIALFEQHLEHQIGNASRRLAEVRRFATERREPLRALVQG